VLATLRVLKALILLVLFVGLLAASAYLYAWWQVTRTADALKNTIAPFLDMRYDSVEIDPLQSEAGLLNVRLTPVGMQDAVLVERMVFKTANPWSLLMAPTNLEKGRLPEAFSFVVSGINFDLQSDFMQMLTAQTAAMQAQVGTSYETLGCGDLNLMGLKQWQQMGFRQLTSDLQLNYRMDPLVQSARFDLFAETAGVARVESSLQIGVSEQQPTLAGLMTPNTLLESIEVRMQDLGYNLRRNRLCAQLNEEEVAEYRTRYREMLAIRLAQDGWSIPVALLDAYDTLNNPGGSMLVRVRPQMVMGPQAAALLQQPGDLLAVLKPYVEFSGKPASVQDVRWDPNKKQKPALAEPSPATPAESESATASTEADDTASETRAERLAGIGKPLIVLPQPKTLQRVKVHELSGHIGQHAVLRTYFGRRVEGRIVSVTGAEVVIEHRPPDGRGTATYPIARDKIQVAEVLF